MSVIIVFGLLLPLYLVSSNRRNYTKNNDDGQEDNTNNLPQPKIATVVAVEWSVAFNNRCRYRSRYRCCKQWLFLCIPMSLQCSVTPPNLRKLKIRCRFSTHGCRPPPSRRIGILPTIRPNPAGFSLAIRRDPSWRIALATGPASRAGVANCPYSEILLII